MKQSLLERFADGGDSFSSGRVAFRLQISLDLFNADARELRRAVKGRVGELVDGLPLAFEVGEIGEDEQDESLNAVCTLDRSLLDRPAQLSETLISVLCDGLNRERLCYGLPADARLISDDVG